MRDYPKEANEFWLIFLDVPKKRKIIEWLPVSLG